MKIVVINGSPSGTKGATSHHVKYLERLHPEHEFLEIEVARRIHGIERKEERFTAIVAEMRSADVIIWAFPVYLMLVSAQLKRFVELLFERLEPGALAGKLTTTFSTSGRHYDHTAHDYMEGICADLDMVFVRGFSASYDCLANEKGRRDLEGFAKELFRYTSGATPVDAGPPRIEHTPQEYTPDLPPEAPKSGDKRIVVITDAGPEDRNLLGMIDMFERSVGHPVDRLELRKLRIKGGCLGCMRCADGSPCVYKDDYAEAFDERVRPADVVIYAGVVRDRYLSAQFKVFIDRYFSNGHRPVLRGKLMGFLISGPLGQLATLREILEAHIQVAHCHRLGIVTDEDPDSEVTTARLRSMVAAAERWLENPWYAPSTFLGAAADKNFRDLVYSHRGIMPEDHRFYRDHGFYDFPQYRIGERVFNTVLYALRCVPFLKRKMIEIVRSGHTRSLRKVLETA